MASSVSELMAYGLSGVFFTKFGARISFVTSFAIAVAGGVLILAYGLAHEEQWTFVLLVLFAKFGIACSQNIIFVANNSIFPPLFASTALGLCGFPARIFSSLSPILAQMDEPLPMICFTVTSAIAMALSFILKDVLEPQSKKTKQTEEETSTV